MFNILIFISFFIPFPFIHSNRILSKPTYIINDVNNNNHINSYHGNSFDKLNISNYLWHLFQNRNLNSYQIQKPTLYYIPNSNNNNNITTIKFNQSNLFNHYKPLQTFENVNIFRKLKNDRHHHQGHLKTEVNSKLRTLNKLFQISQLTIIPHQIPIIPNERPFHDHVLLNYNEMIRLLGGHNFNNEFMSFNKPWEAIMYPRGRLISFTKYDRNNLETITSLNRNRRSRKIKPQKQQQLINIYDRYKKKKKKQNHLDPSSSNLFQNVMDRLKLIQNLKYKNHLHNRMKKNRQLRRILREFLNDYNNCPLYYIWYDLGPKFWPRWIKTSQCVNLANTSCSLPPGMYCHEKNIENIAILRYICPEKWPLSKCNWYRVHLPIVTECSCQCTSKSIHRKDS
ncbi:unnamed protein product [Schistosoma rodhaini]|uniref:Noggin n=1 Tax=Schistosoma rodhaini TaxID=6188 RepID=A0AA85GFA7_9TREM|nr:unnamed protein product [Schistosoma rodhaini]